MDRRNRPRNTDRKLTERYNEASVRISAAPDLITIRIEGEYYK